MSRRPSGVNRPRGGRRAGKGRWKGKVERGRWRDETRKNVDTCRNYKSRDEERTIRDVGLGGHLTGEVRDVLITIMGEGDG